MEESVSVIIPFYNGKEWLEKAIKSVLKQTLMPCEIIVINDGSKENIDDLMIKYNSIINFVYQNNKGSASARNHGIRIAKGEYIAFLDSDDLWKKNKLELQLEFMRKNNLNWSHCPYIVFDDKTHKILKRVDNGDLRGSIFPKSLARCSIATPSVIIKKKCIDELDMCFNERMRQGQDYCFWNVLAKRYNIGNVGEYLVYVRNHSSNKANDILVQLKSKSQMYDYIKENSDYFGEIPFLIRLAFVLSKFGFYTASMIKTTIIKKVVSYLLYALPWFLFRAYYSLKK